MSNDQKLQKPLIKYKVITDKKIIEELDKLPLYIPPNETEETYDTEFISGEKNDLTKSSEKAGELRPIEVSIWFDDPQKESTNSIDRIHLRIIDGRHRYKINPNWRREYHDFSEFARAGSDPIVEYYFAKGHFDMRKTATKEERKVWVNDMCEHAMKSLGLPPQECCTWVIQQARIQGISNEKSIRDVCPKEFKDPSHVLVKEGKTFAKTGKDTKEIKKLKKVAGEKFVELEATKLRLETENVKLEKENIGLHEEANNTQRVVADLQQQLRLVANIEQESKCEECGKVTKLSVDASSGKVLVSESKGTARIVIPDSK